MGSAPSCPDSQLLDSSPFLSQKMPNRICQLTPSQARDVELRGILPDCRNVDSKSSKAGNHCHLDAKEADRMVGENDGTGEARWVGGFRMIAMNVKGGWNTVRMSKQLTDYPTMLPPGHYAIEASGARGRRTSVYATNHAQPVEATA